MEVLTYWEKKGRQEGKEELVVRMITRRFGTVPPEVTKRLDGLSAEALNELGVALFDLTSLADLENWLAQHRRASEPTARN